MPTVKNISKWPVDLDDGTVLKPNSTATVDTTWPRVAALISGGDLQVTDAVNPPAPVLTKGLAIARFKAGAPTDADYASPPPVGTIVVDTTNSKIWVKTAASAGWKGVVVA